MKATAIEKLPDKWRVTASALRSLGERAQVVEMLTDCADELDAAIALMRGQSWQPISTAPRDGSEVLISNVGRSVVVASYERDYGGWCYRWHPYDGPSVYGDATHWQPLPAPPQQEPAE